MKFPNKTQCLRKFPRTIGAVHDLNIAMCFYLLVCSDISDVTSDVSDVTSGKNLYVLTCPLNSSNKLLQEATAHMANEYYTRPIFVVTAPLHPPTPASRCPQNAFTCLHSSTGVGRTAFVTTSVFASPSSPRSSAVVSDHVYSILVLSLQVYRSRTQASIPPMNTARPLHTVKYRATVSWEPPMPYALLPDL